MQDRPKTKANVTTTRHTAGVVSRAIACLFLPAVLRYQRSAPNLNRRTIGLLACAAISSTAAVACNDTYQEETDLFEEAERHYQHGDYEGAVERYEEFLIRHPRSQLAPIAEQRILIVRSELDSVMERRNVEPPIRVNAYRQPTSGGQ